MPPQVSQPSTNQHYPRNRPKTPPRGIEPLLPGSQPVASKAVTSHAPGVLPECLPDSAQNDPELTAVIRAWPELPEAIRAGIVAMVEAAKRLK